MSRRGATLQAIAGILMATGVARGEASAFLLAVLLAVALAAASVVFLQAGLDARRRERRREQRRERQRRAGQAAAPPSAPSEADEHTDAPALARPPSLSQRRPTRDNSIALRPRPARDTSPRPALNPAASMELLGFLRGLDAKFRLESRLEQDDPEGGAALHPKTKKVSRCDVRPEQGSNVSHCLPGTPLGASAASPGGNRRLLSKRIVAGDDVRSRLPVGGSHAGTRPVLDFSASNLEHPPRANNANACCDDDAEHASIPVACPDPSGQRYHAVVDSASQREEHEAQAGQGTLPDLSDRFAAPARPVYSPTLRSPRYPTTLHPALGARARPLASEDPAGYQSSGSV